MWSGFEYWGETCGWPMVTSQFGVLDICRFPKDTYYYFLQEWTSEPMVHVFPHWNCAGKEGTPVDVWCYSNCEQVELLLNGESLGIQDLKPLTHLAWQVPYQPGCLCARGIIGGQTVRSHEVRTSGDPSALLLTADRDAIAAEGRDISFITISVCDASGLPVPTACDDIGVEVTGPGRLIGLCSGDPGSHENPKTASMKAFSGLLLAIVQGDGRSGDITVTASSGALTPGSLTLNAR
jgi:beta-galactosidase